MNNLRQNGLRGWEVDGTGSGSRAVVGFGISGVAGPWDHSNRGLINKRTCL